MAPLTIVLIILALIAIWLVFMYNSLISKRNRVDEAWADIEVQLKRRYNLIPNLIETVKGYAKHESDVLNQITEARSRAISTHGTAEQAEAENMLTAALRSVFAVAENYPDLKASQNFLDLQDDLTDTEDKIQAARRFYNSNVRDYNTAIQQFPKNIVAGMFSFTQRDFFEVATAEERNVVEVKF